MSTRDSKLRWHKRRLLRLESLESRDLLAATPLVSLQAETFKPAFDYTSTLAVSGTYQYGKYALPFKGYASPNPTGTASFITDTGVGSFTLTNVQGSGSWTAPARYDYGTFTFTSGDFQGTTGADGKLTSGTGTISIVISSTPKGKVIYSPTLEINNLTGSFNAATHKFSFSGKDPNASAISMTISGSFTPDPGTEPSAIVLSTPANPWTSVPGATSTLEVDVAVPGPVLSAASYTSPAATVAMYWADATGKQIGKALAPKINIGWNEATGVYKVSNLPVPPANAANLVLDPLFGDSASLLVALPARPTVAVNDVQVTPVPATSTTPAVLSTTFDVTLSQASDFPVTVAYATVNGTAIARTDYTAANGTLTFAPGETVKQVTIAVKPNAKATSNKLFYLNVTKPTWATLGVGRGVCTITQYAHPTISISDDQVIPTPTEKTASFDVTLSAPSPFPITVNYATVNGNAVARKDYMTSKGTLKFAPWETVKTITVPVMANAKAPGPTTFVVNLSKPVWATTADAQADCTLTPYAHPTISVDNAEFTRPQSGTATGVFMVRLSAASPFTVTVACATINGTALAKTDYLAVSKTLTFLPGVTEMPVSVTIKADAKAAADELFTLNLKSAVWATLANSQAVGTIKPYTPPVSSTLLQPLASYFGPSAQRDKTITILPTVLDAILAKSGV